MSPSINTMPSGDPNTPETNDTPGRRLRALRESRKLDIERVAAQLHLQRHVVESLEGDHYERLPAPVFVVGYLKNYARLLGADPTPIIAAYRDRVPVHEISFGQAANGAVESTSGSGRWIWVIGILLIGVAAGMGTLWLRGQTDSGLPQDRLAPSKTEDSASVIAAPTKTPGSPGGAASSTTAASPQSEPEPAISAPPESIPLRPTEARALAGTNTTRPEPAAPATAAPAETLVAANTLAGVTTTTGTPAESNAEQEAQSAEEAEAEAPAPETTSTEVVLEFTGTSWVDVRGANGRVVLNGEMRSGDRRVLDGEPPYKFVIGNAAATRLTIGGRPYDLKRRAQGNVARFSLDPNSFE
ncbi:RodZ domain-containing protein [Allochromatium tepidum]|nr:RodZ domain-containing protein [Allochromatium tepidum]